MRRKRGKLRIMTKEPSPKEENVDLEKDGLTLLKLVHKFLAHNYKPQSSSEHI